MPPTPVNGGIALIFSANDRDKAKEEHDEEDILKCSDAEKWADLK